MSRSGALVRGRSGSRGAPRSRSRRQEPRATLHLGIRAARPTGLDRSLDCRHLAIADTLDPGFEDASGDRAHDAREVDLDPHLGLGLLIARRLELHSPARRGSAHRPGALHAPGRLNSDHLLASVATRPENPLRPLVHPRSGLKRGPSANPTFENRWRPLRPASDVTDIRPYFLDAAGDRDAALGPDSHRAYLLSNSSGWLGSPP